MIIKEQAICKAIRNSSVGDNIIIQNEDGSIWCILELKTVEHPEHRIGDVFHWMKGWLDAYDKSNKTNISDRVMEWVEQQPMCS